MLLALLVLILSAGLYLYGLPLWKESKPTGKVRVGYLADDMMQVAYAVAQNKTIGNGTSLYEKYGLQVEDALGAPYPNGGVEMDHFAAGDVDIGMLGVAPAIIKHINAGVNTTIIAQVNEGGAALVVGSDINNFSDLEGKTVAVPSRSSIQYFMLLMLAEKNSVEMSKITTIDLAPKDMRAKLESGNIAGFIAWEPFISEAVMSGAGKVLATSSDVWRGMPDCVVAVDREFASKNPELVKNFLRAHVEATSWINNALLHQDSEEYKLLAAITVKFTGRNESIVKEAFKLISYKAEIDQAFKESIASYTEKLIKQNIVSSAKLKERGYANTSDFVGKYIAPRYS